MTQEFLRNNSTTSFLFFNQAKRPFYFFHKRLFDILFSLLVLTVLSPIYLFIYFMIFISSSGNPFYAQKRFGQGGKVFTCYKFRTMHNDADRILEEILLKNPHLQQEWMQNQKLKNDPRVFSFGHFLRKTSFDELPQFWNVLKGDLSVVGPRPYMLTQKSELEKYAMHILSVKPGITGLWQTSGRSNTTFQQRLQLDAAYLDHQSFALDLKLIVKTIFQVLHSKDAY